MPRRPTISAARRAPRLGWGAVLGVGVVALVCAALYALAAGAGPEARLVGLRLTLLAGAGLCAVLPPHLLFPEPDDAWLRLVNVPPAQLLARAARRWGGVLALMLAALATVAFAPGQPGSAYGFGARALHFAAYALASGAVWAAALLAYARLGPVSQGYQEGSQGVWLRKAMSNTSAGRLEIPYGLAPTLLATVRVFLLGTAALLAVAYAGKHAGAFAALGAGAVACALAALALLRARTHFDRVYYHTDALYREVLHVTPLDADAREPIAYAAAYWVPHAFRPLAWASLRQMDRRLPLGRLVALLHAALWLVVLRTDGAGPALSVALGAVVIVPILAGSLGQGAAAWPTGWSAWLASPRAWALARGFVALRWLAPLVASLAGLVVFAERIGWPEALAWSAAYVALAFASAALTTARLARAARYA